MRPPESLVTVRRRPEASTARCLILVACMLTLAGAACSSGRSSTASTSSARPTQTTTTSTAVPATALSTTMPPVTGIPASSPEACLPQDQVISTIGITDLEVQGSQAAPTLLAPGKVIYTCDYIDSLGPGGTWIAVGFAPNGTPEHPTGCPSAASIQAANIGKHVDGPQRISVGSNGCCYRVSMRFQDPEAVCLTTKGHTEYRADWTGPTVASSAWSKRLAALLALEAEAHASPG